MPIKFGVPAQLIITYKKPTMAGQFLALVATTTKVDGRKAWSKGAIIPLEELVMNEDGTIQETGANELVSADALFIEPKHAKVSFSQMAATNLKLTNIGSEKSLLASHLNTCT